jgi:hypothetical protein
MFKQVVYIVTAELCRVNHCLFPTHSGRKLNIILYFVCFSISPPTVRPLQTSTLPEDKKDQPKDDTKTERTT